MATKVKTKTKQEQHKSIQLLGIGQVKSVKDGVVIEGWANKATVDRMDEMIEVDAWDLDNYKKNPVILYNHGFDPQLGSTPIGKAVEVRPTDEGLFIRAQLASIDDPLINRVRGLVEERILRAFSVGFSPKVMDTDADTGIRHIKKAELFEVSIVGVPMNQDSLFEVNGKMLKSMTVADIKGEILTRKGAGIASLIHSEIFNRQRDNGETRQEILDQLMAASGLSVDELMEILAGNITPVPDEFVEAVAPVLGYDIDYMKQFNAADAEYENNEGEQSEEQGEEREDQPGEAGEEADQEMSETEESQGGNSAGNEDDKDPDSDPEDGEDEADKEPKRDLGKSKGSKADDFQQCVSEKIPKLLDEGKEQDQAIAIAIAMCSEKGKCAIRPTKDFYKKWFKQADDHVEKKMRKQADQGEEVPDTTTTIPAAKTEAENDEFGSPYLDAQKQTNVLLGVLINEVQKLSAKMNVEVAVEEPTQTESVEETPTDEEVESAKSILLKFPIEPSETSFKVLNAFKDEFSSRGQDKEISLAYSMLVCRMIDVGIGFELNEKDPLDAGLENGLKVKLRELHDKRLDSFVKRLDNVKKRLSSLEG